MKTRSISVILVMVLLIGLLAGCASGELQTSPPAESVAVPSESLPQPEVSDEPMSEEDLLSRMEEIISDPEHPLAAASIGIIKDGVSVEFINIKELSKEVFIQATLDEAKEYITEQYYSDAKRVIEFLLKHDPDNAEAPDLLEEIALLEELTKTESPSPEVSSSPSPTPSSPSGDGYIYDSKTGEWIAPPTSGTIQYDHPGYIVASRDKLYSNVKLYWLDSSDMSIHHAYTILNWGNESGAMKGRVFVEDKDFDNKQYWAYKEEFVDMTPSEYGVFLIKEDDPALAKKEMIYKSTDADNYRQIETEDLVTGKEVYWMMSDGTMVLDYIVVKWGFLTVDTISADSMEKEEVDITWAINDHYVKK